MTILIELERTLLDQGHSFTTFKECSMNEKDNGTVVFVSENETMEVFNLDEIKDNLSAERFSAPMSIDAMWVDHTNKILHLIEFKDAPDLRGSKRKDIRLKILDTLLFLNNEYKEKFEDNKDIVFVLVRRLSVRELSSYHVRAKAKKYTPAYLEYIQELANIKVLELKPEDFERYIENSNDF